MYENLVNPWLASQILYFQSKNYCAQWCPEITKSRFWDSIAYILRAWDKSESSCYITESTPEGGRSHETEAV